MAHALFGGAFVDFQSAGQSFSMMQRGQRPGPPVPVTSVGVGDFSTTILQPTAYPPVHKDRNQRWTILMMYVGALQMRDFHCYVSLLEIKILYTIN